MGYHHLNLIVVVLALIYSCYASGKKHHGRAAEIEINDGLLINGRLMLEQASRHSPVRIRGTIYGLEPGKHGMHVHSGRQLGENCELVGDHFNPTGRSHGGPRDAESHVGDLGNIEVVAGSPSQANVSIISLKMSLFEDSPNYVIGRVLAIHSGVDDLGTGKSRMSRTMGDSGPIVTCALIKAMESVPQSTSSEKTKMESFADVDGIIYNVEHPLHGADRRSSGPSQAHLELNDPMATDKVWKMGNVYEFDYDGLISTSMPGIGPQQAGASIKGRLLIESLASDLIEMRLVDTTAKTFHDIHGMEQTSDEGAHSSNLADRHHLEKPVHVRMVNGKVETISIAADEPLWTVNFKRALAGQLQLQIDAKSAIFSQRLPISYYSDNAIYHVMEGGSSGECRTWYQISRLGAEQLAADPTLLPAPQLCADGTVYEIVKSRDLDRCRLLAVFNYASSGSQRCSVLNAGSCEGEMSHADTVKMIACRSAQADHLIVQRLQSLDRLSLKPFGYETETVDGQTVQHLHLRVVRPSTSSTNSTGNLMDAKVYQTLSYAFEEAHQLRGPLMSQPSLGETHSTSLLKSDVEIMKGEAQRLLNEIVTAIESDEFVSDKIDMLRQTLAQLDSDALVALVSRNSDGPIDWNSTVEQILVDALVLAGTNPSLEVVRQMISDGRLRGEQAAQAVSALPATVKTPTVEMFSAWMDLLQSPSVADDIQLKITTALALTRLIYKACVNDDLSINSFPRLVMGRFCHPDEPFLVARLLPWLVDQLNTAVDSNHRIAFLAALGNLGHEMILPSVIPYISSCEPSTTAEFEFHEGSRPDLGDATVSAPNPITASNRHKWLLHKLKRKQQKLKLHAQRPKRVIDSLNPSDMPDLSDRIDQLDGEMEEDEELDIATADANDAAACSIVRSKAIFALSHLIRHRKTIISSILMPIYFNKEEPAQIRMSALTLLFVADQTPAFWQRVALSTWLEPDNQLVHFIHTTVTSTASASNGGGDAAQRARSVLSMLKPLRWPSYVSSNYRRAAQMPEKRLGYSAAITTFPGFESFVPSNHYAQLRVQMGTWATKLVEYAVSSKHSEKLFDSLLSQVSSSRGPQLAAIDEQLKIEARATGQPQLLIYWNLVDNYQRFLAVGPLNIKQLMATAARYSQGQLSINYHKMVPLTDKLLRIPSAMGLAYTLTTTGRIFVSARADVDVQRTRNKSGIGALSVDARPVVEAALTHETTLEMPFARSFAVAGARVTASAALPIRTNHELSMNQWRSTWSIATDNDRVLIAQQSTVPFTSVRRVGNFQTTLELHQTRPVMMLEHPQKVERVFGQSLFGLKLHQTTTGDADTMPKRPAFSSEDWLATATFWAFTSTLRYHKSDLVLDKTQSTTHSATAVVMFEKNRRKIDFSLELEGQKDRSNNRHFGASFAYDVDPDGLSQSALFKFSRDKDFFLCAEMMSNQTSPNMVRRENLARDAATRTASLLVGFGQSCSDDRRISVTAKLNRGPLPEKQTTVRSRLLEQRCTHQELTGRGISEECVSTRRLASILNKGVVVVDYNEMPTEVREIGARITRLFQNWLDGYLYDNQVGVSNQENRIVVESVYYPVIGSLDLRVYQPRSNTFYEAIKVPPTAEVLLPFNPRMDTTRALFGAPSLCLVDEATVTSFDGLTYNTSIASCDQVLTKDCSGRYHMAVLVRHDNIGYKVVTILLDHWRIELNPATMTMAIDDQPSQPIDTDGRVQRIGEVALVRRTSDGFLQLEAPQHSIRVTCNAREVVVLGSPLHRGRLCGLCGSENDNKADDLTGPRKCALPGALMGSAYELNRPAGCSTALTPEQSVELQQIQKICLQRKSDVVFGLSNARPLLPRSQQSRLSLAIRSAGAASPPPCTEFRNKMIHRHSRRCFSTVATPKCQSGCRPERMEHRKIGFHCVDSGSFSDQLMADLYARPLDELIGKEISKVEVFHVPTSCIPY